MRINVHSNIRVFGTYLSTYVWNLPEHIQKIVRATDNASYRETRRKSSLSFPTLIVKKFLPILTECLILPRHIHPTLMFTQLPSAYKDLKLALTLTHSGDVSDESDEA